MAAPAQFSWAAGADAGLGLASAFSSWASADASAIVSKANADAANTVRKAQNEQRASGLSLSATLRSIVDKRVLDSAGLSANNATEAAIRTQQSFTRGNVEQGLRDVENLGAVSARASAAGVGGASVEAVSYSVRLQQARLAQRMGERDNQITYEQLKQRSGIMPNAVDKLDLTPLTAGFDYTNSIASNQQGSLIAALTEGLLRKKDSLQVALNSIPLDTAPLPTTGDFARMDRLRPITID